MPRREVTGNRRNSTSRDELVDFQWKRAVRGYTVVDVPAERISPSNRDALDLPLGQRYAVPADIGGGWTERMVIERDVSDRLQRVEVVRFPMRLGGPVPLFAVLANIGAASRTRSEAGMTDEAALEDRIVSFAVRHGLLGRPVKLAMPDDRMAFGEPVSLWEREVQDLRDVLRRWHPGVDGTVPTWSSDDERLKVQRTVNERIGAHAGAGARLLWDRATERLVLRLVPETLLGALWLQLARWIDVGARFIRCRRCARWISLHPDPAIGRRSQTRTCSERCRKALHDDARARALHQGAGRSGVGQQALV